jgi:hypothetical protein
MRHQDLTLNHRLESWVYPDAPSRTGATGFVSGDVGRIAYQTDTGEYWRLTATTPTWQKIPAIGGLPVGGTAGQRLTKSSATDYAASWATPVADVPAGGTVGQLLCKNSATNYDAAWATINAFPVQSGSLGPGGTSSTTGVMMGLGASAAIGVQRTGKVLVIINGTIKNGTASGSSTAQIRYGTGTAPANGAAPAGTPVGAIVQANSPSANFNLPFSVAAFLTGLTLGTTYWFDLLVATAGGAGPAAVSGVTVAAFEVP